MPQKKPTLTTLMNLAVNDSDYEYAITGSVSCECAWHLIMQQGNSHFEHGRYLRAHSVYSDALALAHAAVPVVVITGHDTPESRTRALRLGAKAYLCKPVDDEALLSAIGTAIDRAAPRTAI